MENMFISEKQFWPCSFKGAVLYSIELVAISTAFNAQKHLQRFHSFIVNQHSEITFTFSKILKHSAVSKG